MKTVKLFFAALLLAVMSSTSFAQVTESKNTSATKTETIKVQGNCGMCKARIEKAAKFDGVSKAEWNTESKILAVTYDPSKTNIDAISRKVAAAGHDNAKVKADNKAYDALPGCCKYR